MKNRPQWLEVISPQDQPMVLQSKPVIQLPLFIPFVRPFSRKVFKPVFRAGSLPKASRSVWKLIAVKNHIITMNGKVKPGKPKWPVNLLIIIWIGGASIQPTSITIHAVHQLPFASAVPENVQAPIAIRFGQKPKRPEVIASLSAPMR